MMSTAYVLMNVQPGKAQEVHQQLHKLQDVRQVDLVFGPYDMIVMIQATDAIALGKLVLEKLSRMDGVTHTLTCNVIPVEH
jgi:DNA-binding Lrp family transcriptional regulator